MLTDILEVHFIELPKFKKTESRDYKNNKLQRWLAFLSKETSDIELEVLMGMDENIKRAEKKLDDLAQNPEAREKAHRDKVSIINSAIREGKKEEKRNIAKKLIGLLDTDIIAEKTGLTIEEVKEIEKEIK